MILSRAKPALQSGESSKSSTQSGGRKQMHFEEYLKNRDYMGAKIVLEFHKDPHKEILIEQWMAYCDFHRGDYKHSLDIYESLFKTDENIDNLAVNIACCYFYLGMYEESKTMLEKAPSSGLKSRLSFHLAHKLRDETTLMEYHQKLQDILEDQLSLAAIHFLRAHYQEAIDIYKRLLLQDRDNIAFNVYVALCYYKLDYYDVSQEALALYLNHYPDSVIANNLKACNTFRLYNGSAAENELRNIVEQSSNVGFGNDLLKHNLVVFRGGEGALKVFPSLVDIVPEARLNLVIHYLNNNDTKEAYELLRNHQPAVPQEYILKGVVNATLGQEINSPEHIKVAEECFHLVGSSPSECDTIHGRQCMAAAFFLAGQFEEVLVYLTSIKSYLHSDDTFNFNFGQAKTACGQFVEAEEALQAVKDPLIRSEAAFIACLLRCLIMNGKAQKAWELCNTFRQETESDDIEIDAAAAAGGINKKSLGAAGNADSFNLLLLVANDCYRAGEFWYSAKAFDVLDKLEPNPEFWEGKRGAIVGVFQAVIAKQMPMDMLDDVLQLLRASTSTQADQIAKVIRKWAKEQQNM